MPNAKATSSGRVRSKTNPTRQIVCIDARALATPLAANRTVPLNSKVILLTGAASGIGAATATLLQKRGAQLVLLDNDSTGLAARAAALPQPALCISVDVTSPADCHQAVAQAVAQHGRIDVVWANAGIAAFGPLAHTDPIAWKRCLDVNVMGVFNTVHAALPAIQKSRGYVLTTASVATFAHPPFMSAYAASKAAVEAMCNAWRIELAAHGVAVGVVHPSWVKTALVTEGALHPAFARLRATMPGPLNSEATPELAARLIADGIEARARRIWVPGWVRVLYWLRAALHTPLAERELLRAAPEMERLYVEGLAAEGRLASSFGPRELQKTLAREVAKAEQSPHVLEPP
jgi:NAD(P)-dependent dehydrogenase (short-subunit alcohol dehydrogenase family)